MAEVKFIYFEGCPNAEKTRTALKQAGILFEDINQGDLSNDSPYKNYSSPTILQGSKIIFGCETGEGSGGCSLDIPTVDDLKSKFGLSSKTDTKSGFLSSFGSLGSAMTVGLCPICIPALGAFLSSIGLGFMVQESFLLPILLVFLAVTFGGLLWSYLKEHKKIGPLVGGVLMGLSLYLGRYVYFGAVINQIMMYGGVAGIIAISFWNLQLRKKSSCSTCLGEPKDS